MAPVNETNDAILSTWSVLNLLNRYTARKSEGGDSSEKDIAHMLTVTVDERP